MKRDERLKKLSWDHHHGLVMALRIERELPGADDAAAGALYARLVSFWTAGLLPHFRVENECLLARLIRHVAGSDDVITRTQADHLGIEALVATMRDARSIGERRQALGEFGQALRDHIRWEESVLFEVTQTALTDPELDALKDDIDIALPEVIPAP